MLGKYSIEDDSVFISQSTQIWGNVEFSHGSSAWFDVILRSPQGQIQIGYNSHICDQTRISNSQNSSMSIGNNVYIGSQCSLADCDIANGCYIGERCIIHPGTIIPSGSFITANSMIVSQTIFPENSFIQGSPASSIGYVTAEMREEHEQVSAKIKKEISLYRKNIPQAELTYFLIEFSSPTADSQRVLEAIYRAGAGEFLNYNDFLQTSSCKLDYNSAVGKSSRQELTHSVACPGYKLQAVIEALGQSFPKRICPFFTVKPLYFVPPAQSSSHAAKEKTNSGSVAHFAAPSRAGQSNTAVKNAKPTPSTNRIIFPWEKTGTAPEKMEKTSEGDSTGKMPQRSGSKDSDKLSTTTTRMPPQQTPAIDKPVIDAEPEIKIPAPPADNPAELVPVLKSAEELKETGEPDSSVGSTANDLLRTLGANRPQPEILKVTSTETSIFSLYPEFFEDDGQLKESSLLPSELSQASMLKVELLDHLNANSLEVTKKPE